MRVLEFTCFLSRLKVVRDIFLFIFFILSSLLFCHIPCANDESLVVLVTVKLRKKYVLIK